MLLKCNALQEEICPDLGVRVLYRVNPYIYDMNADNKKFLKFCLLVFLTATLAYSLYFLFELGWKGYIGEFTADHYFWGVIVRAPWWMIGLFIADRLMKITISRKVTFLLEALLFGALLAPLVISTKQYPFDYVFIPFGIIDFFLCLALLTKLRLRLIEP